MFDNFERVGLPNKRIRGHGCRAAPRRLQGVRDGQHGVILRNWSAHKYTVVQNVGEGCGAAILKGETDGDAVVHSVGDDPPKNPEKAKERNMFYSKLLIQM